MNSDNKVQNTPSHSKVASSPGEAAPTPNVSPVINDVAKDEREAPVKQPAENELVTNQIREPKMLTDQESGAIETAKHEEQLTEAK